MTRIQHAVPPDTEETTISSSAALKLAHSQGKKITVKTLHQWIDPHKNPGIAYQPAGPGGRYYIYKLKFLRLITGREV